MNDTMCDKELLVGYLYDEIDAAQRRRMDTHLAACAACRDEVAGLRVTRQHLGSWAPPESRRQFQIVSVATRPRRRFQFAPAWGLAAAAVLVLAAAAAIANVEFRYGADGMVVRTGWGRAAAPATESAAAQPAPALSPAEWNAAITAIDERLRDLETSRASMAGVRQAAGPRVSDAEVLRRVRELLNDSETRQNRQLALRITQLYTEIDAQRRVDLDTIRQGLQGTSNTNRELWNAVSGLYRVAQQTSK